VVSSKRLVIVNPSASRVRDAAFRRALLDDLAAVLESCDGSAPQFVETQSRADTLPAVEAGLSAGSSGVVGVGGDGTLRDIATALARTGIPLGVVPAGTGNQLASALGVPRSPQQAVAALARARPRSVDLGEVTIDPTDGPAWTGLFTIGCGAGFDARVMATTPPAWKRRAGTAAYFVQAIKLAVSVGVQPYRMTIDGRLVETEASVAMVGNMGHLVPGLLRTRLPLDPHDGLLDLLVVGARNPIHGLRGLADQVWRTSLGGGAGASSLRLRGHAIAIEPARPEPLEVDGDYVAQGSLRTRVLPAALEVLVPHE
jgi:diacylglycerol kinase family enzyme